MNFLYFLQEKAGFNWESVMSTPSLYEAADAKAQYEMPGRKFRIVARAEVSA